MVYNGNGLLIDFDCPKVMGIINVTPDSFYAASRKFTSREVLLSIEQMIEDGADIIDIGAMSSRPGAKAISSEEEEKRLIPVLKEIKRVFPDTLVSIDTYRASIAKKAMDIGANIINDISGGNMDPQMFEVMSQFPVPYILMHMKGQPSNMQEKTNVYYDDIVMDIIKYFKNQVFEFQKWGKKEIILDPGFGFSKTLNDNYLLLNQLSSFALFDLPILVGVSRKSMIYKLLDISPEESLPVSSALHLQALLNGASILRVHDVKEAAQMIQIYQQLQSNKLMIG